MSIVKLLALLGNRSHSFPVSYGTEYAAGPQIIRYRHNSAFHFKIMFRNDHEPGDIVFRADIAKRGLGCVFITYYKLI